MSKEWIQDFLKPREDAKTNQGTFHPQNPHKYKGDLSKIYFRSGWELKFFQMCDTNPLITEYASECVKVPYISPIDNRPHEYFIDIYMEMKLSDGSKQKWLIEIKPEKFTKLPKEPKKKTAKAMKNYRDHVATSLTNIEKFKSAKFYSKQMGAMFGVVSINKDTQQFKLVEWDESNIY